MFRSIIVNPETACETVEAACSYFIQSTNFFFVVFEEIYLARNTETFDGVLLNVANLAFIELACLP